MSDLSIFELRQYTLLGGERETLIDLFEREFIESQNACGMTVLGRYRDEEDPDRFVWMRGFSDMEARRQALSAFYGGPVWNEHGAAANATMRDSDNVLLLRPAAGGQGLDMALSARPPLMRITIHDLASVGAADFNAFFEAVMVPLVAASGGEVVAALATAEVENSFPRLPVRGDRVFAWIAFFDGVDEERSFTQRLNVQSGWRDDIPENLFPALARKPEVLRLTAL